MEMPKKLTAENSGMNCPQCGHEETEFVEGVCKHCWEYDRWESMSDYQRDKEIRRYARIVKSVEDGGITV